MKKYKNSSFGFTVVEIVIVVGIIAVILGVVIASVSSSKDKGADAETKKVISELALRAEGKDIAPGVMDYQAAFSSINADSTLRELATKYQVADGQYQYIVTPSSYAIVFPLKKGKYYCVDSLSHGSAIEVPTLFQDRGPQSCYGVAGLALGGGGAGGGGSSISINLPSNMESCRDGSFCTTVYSQSSMSTVVARGGFMDKMKDLLAQALGSDESGAGVEGQPKDGGDLPPADSGTISVGVSIGIDPSRQGNLLSDYFKDIITATDAEGNDITRSIETQEFDPAFLKSVSDGPNYDFSKSEGAFPKGAGGQFSDCGSPYAIKYTVSDDKGNTKSQIQEYMTCTDVKFSNFEPLK